MLSFDTIDVAIGLTLLFLLMSLFCTSLREAIEGVMKTRASDLERGVRQILQDDGELTERFYQHPLIYSLFAGDYSRPDAKALIRRGGNLPSYIPANQFARALIDLVHQGAGAYSPYGTSTPPLTMASLRQAAAQFPNPRVRRAVLFAIDQSSNDLDAARRHLESWFNGSMDRVSGWYKRRTQLILFIIGIALAIVLNVDAISVTQQLQRDNALRETVVANAGRIVGGAQSVDDLSQRAQDVAAQLDQQGFPIGWKSWRPVAQVEQRRCNATGRFEWAYACGDPRPGWTYVLTPGAVAQMILGWLITAVAMMLGAPFWFDVLNRLMVIRATVKPTEKSPDEGSEDRARSRTPAEADTTTEGPRGATQTIPVKEPAGPPSPAASAATPGGFPFIPNKWADDVEEGII